MEFNLINLTSVVISSDEVSYEAENKILYQSGYFKTAIETDLTKEYNSAGIQIIRLLLDQYQLKIVLDYLFGLYEDKQNKIVKAEKLEIETKQRVKEFLDSIKFKDSIYGDINILEYRKLIFDSERAKAVRMNVNPKSIEKLDFMLSKYIEKLHIEESSKKQMINVNNYITKHKLDNLLMSNRNNSNIEEIIYRYLIGESIEVANTEHYTTGKFSYIFEHIGAFDFIDEFRSLHKRKKLVLPLLFRNITNPIINDDSKEYNIDIRSRLPKLLTEQLILEDLADQLLFEFKMNIQPLDTNQLFKIIEDSDLWNFLIEYKDHVPSYTDRVVKWFTSLILFNFDVNVYDYIRWEIFPQFFIVKLRDNFNSIYNLIFKGEFPLRFIKIKKLKSELLRDEKSSGSLLPDQSLFLTEFTSPAISSYISSHKILGRDRYFLNISNLYLIFKVIDPVIDPVSTSVINSGFVDIFRNRDEMTSELFATLITPARFNYLNSLISNLDHNKSMEILESFIHIENHNSFMKNIKKLALEKELSRIESDAKIELAMGRRLIAFRKKKKISFAELDITKKANRIGNNWVRLKFATKYDHAALKQFINSWIATKQNRVLELMKEFLKWKNHRLERLYESDSENGAKIIDNMHSDIVKEL